MKFLLPIKKKFKSFGNKQKGQIKKHAPGLNSGKLSSF